MIKINIDKDDNNKIVRIKVSGHAHYAESGKDIVCAAVSSTVITTVNNILSLSKTIDYLEGKDSLTINVIKDDENTQKILNNMLSMLNELEKDYPKYIKIF
ncbi:MAG: ribosomal-processing cysteine protease Prp [Bacilli bacterium]|nr:ribosomal-processing cysteine protease Prp [Bacilli bacterium]